MALDRLPLNNQIVVKPLLLTLANIFESERDRINAVLQNYKSERGGPSVLRNIYTARRPNRKIENYPSIAMTVTSRSPQWQAQRMTKDTVSIRIFCLTVESLNDANEQMMIDFTDTVVSILFQNPIFSFVGFNGDPPVNVDYTVATSGVAGVAYGNIDEGQLRAGQVDWVGEILLNWPDMNLFPLGYSSSATHLVFDSGPQPGDIDRPDRPLLHQPLISAKTDAHLIVQDFMEPVTLTIKEGTGTEGALLGGDITVSATSGVAVFTGVSIDLPGTGYVLTAQGGGLSGETAPFDISPEPYRLRFRTQPVGVLIEEILLPPPLATQPVVQVEDANGTVVTDYTGAVGLTLVGGTEGELVGDAVTVAVDGIATFSGLKVNRAGTYSLRASSGTLLVADSEDFVVDMLT